MRSPRHGSSEHDTHAGHHTEDFLKKFWVVLALTVPILAYSEVFEIALGFSPPDFVGREWLILALGSVVFFYGGGGFLPGALRESETRPPRPVTLGSLASSA